jgi:spore photoproduct lyase
VLFVNIDDYKNAIDEKLKDDSLYVCLSYDCDILAMEGIFGLAKEFIEFVKTRENLTVEIRTKSANFGSIKNVLPNPQTILAWSISPDKIAQNYEIGAPSLDSRINAAIKAIEAGFRVRLAFEPILAIDSWKNIYTEMIDKIFAKIDGKKLDSVNIDQFRISKPILKRIQKVREDSYILHENLVENSGLVSYDFETIKEIKNSLTEYLLKYLHKSKIYISE